MVPSTSPQHRFFQQEMGDNGEWRHFRTMRRHVMEGLPSKQIGCQLYNLQTGRFEEPMVNMEKIPRKRFPLGKYGSVWESASVKVFLLTIRCLRRLHRLFIH